MRGLVIRSAYTIPWNTWTSPSSDAEAKSGYDLRGRDHEEGAWDGTAVGQALAMPVRKTRGGP